MPATKSVRVKGRDAVRLPWEYGVCLFWEIGMDYLIFLWDNGKFEKWNMKDLDFKSSLFFKLDNDRVFYQLKRINNPISSLDIQTSKNKNGYSITFLNESSNLFGKVALNNNKNMIMINFLGVWNFKESGAIATRASANRSDSGSKPKLGSGDIAIPQGINSIFCVTIDVIVTPNVVKLNINQTTYELPLKYLMQATTILPADVEETQLDNTQQTEKLLNSNVEDELNKQAFLLVNSYMLGNTKTHFLMQIFT